jgi:uncharacterized hydrophobic protein (TIGR00271 family)
VDIPDRRKIVAIAVAVSKNQHQDTVREDIRNGAVLSRAYLLMNVLAAAIASYGLFGNSPSVVISAMIVAVLLGPIVGVSLALVDIDMKLLLKSLCTLLAGATVVMVTAFIIGSIHKDMPITNEITARTAPNLLDLMVALAGGAAGAYATVSPHLSIAVVGVAIAVALVPPLSAAGILFARGEVDLAFGALLLIFTNMVAIQFASSVVLWLNGFRRISRTAGLSLLAFAQGNAISIVILLALAVVFTTSLHRVVARQLYEASARFALQEGIKDSPGSHLVEVRFDETAPGNTIIRAVMRGPHQPSTAQVAALEAQLPIPPHRTAVELRIRFVHTTIMNKEGPLYEDVKFGAADSHGARVAE